MTDGVAQLGLVLDCADPELLAECSAPALGYVNLGAVGGHVEGNEFCICDGGQNGAAP